MVKEGKIEDYTPDITRFNIHRIQRDGGESDSRLADLLPNGLCPYLAHSIIPYILTLSGGGSFPWMNSIDSSAVDAQCPNPAGAVEVRVRKGEKDFSITVLRVRGHCPKGYSPGNLARWPEDIPIHLFDLNIVLSWLIQLDRNVGAGRTPQIQSPSGRSGYRIEKGSGGIVSAQTACPPRAQFQFRLGRFDHRCRYHKLPRREYYDQYNWIPNGMCPELYHAAYPTCLAAIYGGGWHFPDTVVCPNSGKVRLKIRVVDRAAYELRKAVMQSLQKIGLNTELPLRRCYLKVEETSPDCPFEMKLGREFEFNMGDLPELCPAMFHNAYPALVAGMGGSAFPWYSGGDIRGIVQCPDNVSNITMIYKR